MNELEQKLNEALTTFSQEIHFHLETFNQSHEDENLTHRDLDFLGRQIFYCLSDFKDAITAYAKQK